MEKMMTQTAILELGWTKSLINKFLPEPTCKPNPHYKKAAPMKLWNERDVFAAMETENFKDAFKKATRRKNSAQKSIVAKVQNLNERALDLARGLHITVIADDELRTRTLAAKQAWYNHQAYIRGTDYCGDVDCVNSETMERWIVNYIRHNLINYDDECRRLLSGQVGKNSAYVTFKKAILEKIAVAYPAYAAECSLQAESLM